jgi:lipoprotein-anchoring transpeptidase ErfK/SrfK
MPRSNRKNLLPADTLTVALMLALGCAPAMARSKLGHKPEHQGTARVGKEPFGDIPKGPVQIFVSIDQQKLHLYSDGMHVADTSVATGVPSLPTPLGVFSVIQKQIFHRSNLYSNAPMPFMQRITWSGVALHEGESIGHRASHGCIRMPREFAIQLYGLTRIGARVIVADRELKPVEFADAHLFVHKDKPPEPPPAPAPPDVATAAPAADAGKALDPAPGDASGAPPPVALGLRVSADATVTDANRSERKIDAVGSASATPAAALSDPVTATKPAETAKAVPAKKTPIAIFISRKEKKIYVRQDFEPLFDSAVTIDQPERPLGTHLFTALDFLPDHTTLRWNVVSMPGEPPKPVRNPESERRSAKRGRDDRRDEERKKIADDLPPPQTPQQALARIAIPQDAIDRISQLMVPGSSLIVSDQGLGDETGEGTDFIVVTR